MLNKMVSFSFPLVATEQIGLLSRVSRGFLTLPDILVYLASITSAFLNPKAVSPRNADKQIGFILSTKCLSVDSYSAYDLHANVGITDKVSHWPR